MAPAAIHSDSEASSSADVSMVDAHPGATRDDGHYDNVSGLQPCGLALLEFMVLVESSYLYLLILEFQDVQETPDYTVRYSSIASLLC
jgi:hypothetical protein